MTTSRDKSIKRIWGAIIKHSNIINIGGDSDMKSSRDDKWE